MGCTNSPAFQKIVTLVFINCLLHTYSSHHHWTSIWVLVLLLAYEKLAEGKQGTLLHWTYLKIPSLQYPHTVA